MMPRLQCQTYSKLKSKGEASDEKASNEKLRKNIFITTMAILVSNTKSISRVCFRLKSEETPLISQWQSAPVLPLATLVCPHPHPGCEAVLKHSGNKLTVAQMMKSPSISLIMQSNDHLQLSFHIQLENFKLIIISVRNHNPAINHLHHLDPATVNEPKLPSPSF